MVLIDKLLKQLIEEGTISVTPYNPENIQPTSLDVTLGENFKVMEPIAHAISPYETEDLNKVQYRESKDVYILSPGKLLIAHTEEHIGLPDNIKATIQGKSTLARHGIVVHLTADAIHPGWSGQVVLEIVNLGENSIILRRGDPIGTVTFDTLSGPVENPYRGKYQNQSGAQEPKG